MYCGCALGEGTDATPAAVLQAADAAEEQELQQRQPSALTVEELQRQLRTCEARIRQLQ